MITENDSVSRTIDVLYDQIRALVEAPPSPENEVCYQQLLQQLRILEEEDAKRLKQFLDHESPLKPGEVDDALNKADALLARMRIRVLVGWIDQRIDQMLVRPEMWAASTEALESMVILLLEFREFIKTSVESKVFDRYRNFSMRKYPSKPGPIPLSVECGHIMRMADDLKEFVAEERLRFC